MPLSNIVEFIPSFVAIVSILLALWVVFFEKKKNLKKITGEQINNNRTAVGIVELTSYVSKINPDYLVCLNRGGILIGSHISLLLQIPTEKLLKCSIKKDKHGAIVTNCDISEISGKVLIIDSMIRTSDTFSLAIEHINNTKNNITSIETAALVTTVDNNDIPSLKDLSHYVYSTENINIQFPWTNLKDTTSSIRPQLLENEFNQVKDLSPQEIVKSILLPSLQPNLIAPCD